MFVHRIKTGDLVDRVKVLFKGHRNLILGLNQFLPEPFKITLPPTYDPDHSMKMSPIQFNHAIQYVAKVKRTVEPNVYEEFLDLLHDYQVHRRIDEMLDNIKRLFVRTPELLDEFKFYLPERNLPAGAGKSREGGRKNGNEGKVKVAESHRNDVHDVAGGRMDVEDDDTFGIYGEDAGRRRVQSEHASSMLRTVKAGKLTKGSHASRVRTRTSDRLFVRPTRFTIDIGFGSL